jgi:hypothetical protein
VTPKGLIHQLSHFLFRPACLVGFYSTTLPAEGKARILALRSRAPR